MLSLDSLIFDIILPATARPTPEQLVEGLGGEAVAKSRMVLDVDLDVPQLEQEISPTFLLRKRGDRRLLIVGEGPLRENPRTQAIVAKDLRPEKDRLVSLVDKMGARIGRMGAFGTWGDAVIVCRSPRDLRAVLLLGWALDPVTDLEGRRRGQQLSQREFELKLASFEKRLDELDDAAILARVPPATVEKKGPKDAELLVVSALSDRDGSWDIRKSYELEKRVAALDLFSRIPGAKQSIIAPEAEPAPAAAPAEAPKAPEPPPEPPKPAGPPIRAAEIGSRIVLVVPPERLDSDTITALGKRPIDVLTSKDAVTGKQRDNIHQHGAGFIAPLEFLSEVFIEGKPLDRKRFEAEAQTAADGVRTLEAHLPRFGAVRILDKGGKRWITSETTADAAALLALQPR
jgi:hypothetical protein